MGRESRGYYYEQATFDGRWIPVWAAEAPNIKKGRLVRADATGPLVRGLKPVPEGLENLTLFQLQAVLSPDGGLRATGPKTPAAGG